MQKEETLNAINVAKSILVIQGENPDGDSLASSLALEEILESAGKKVHMFCAIDMPKHLRYIAGWDRVYSELPDSFDLTLIVDTASESLLEKTFTPENIGRLRATETIIIDHHDVETTMPFTVSEYVDTDAVSTGDVIQRLFAGTEYRISVDAARLITQSIMYDTRGLSTEAVNAQTLRTVADFVDMGVSLAELEEARHQMNRRDQDISRYKGELLLRVNYDLPYGLATVEITWEEIEKYSDRYNPSILILDEMRLVTGVRMAIAYKTYPDGKILAKIRSNFDAPVASQLAEEFGGGGHPHASGFKLRDEDFSDVQKRVIEAYSRLIREHDDAA